MSKPRAGNPRKTIGRAIVRRVGGPSPSLLADVRGLIELARGRVAVAVNSELVWLYWQIGRRVRQDVLGNERAEYGQQIVHALSAELSSEYGPGFTRANLFHMIRFAEAFPQGRIVYVLRRQLSWTHLRQIIYIDDPLARQFYAEMCRLERWSTRTLERKIKSMLFERTAVTRRPRQLIARELAALRDEDRVTPDLVFRDPYVLDFLGLKDTFAEKDLETAICRELEKFLLELGSDFAFVARRVLSAARDVEAYERPMIQLSKSPDFSTAKLAELMKAEGV